MQTAWMPKVSGILDIVSGCIGLVIAFAFFQIGSVPWETHSIYPAVAGLFAIVGILAILGGICALGRQSWGLALAGSIATFLPFWPLGLTAIVLTAIAKNEFL